MRLFIAICLNDSLKDSLVKLQNEARALGMDGSFSLARNMHVTLAFIGEYERPDDVLKAMREVPIEPFEITVSGTGTFGNILWGGLKCPDCLKQYVCRLRKKLGDRGIPFDVKPFNPHITVARKFNGRAEELHVEERTMTVNRISLMLSARFDGILEYREIGKVPCTVGKEPL